jgi:hypothetical protein
MAAMRTFCCLLLGAVLALVAGCRPKNHPERPLRYVAYVGFNYSDPLKAQQSNYLDSLHIIALQAQLAQLNAAGYPVELRLRSYECDFREDTIPKIYAALAADSSNLLVIDNTWGRHIRHAAPIIRGRLPVIALSADQNQLDFGNNAIFLDPNDPQPDYLVKYIKSVLKTSAIGFITETDYLLHQRFQQVIEQEGLACDTLLKLRQADYVNNNEVPRHIAEVLERNLMRAMADPAQRVILLNTHSGYGNEIMRFLQNTRMDIRGKIFIGLPGVTNLDAKTLEAISTQKGITIIRYESSTEASPVELYRQKKALSEQFPRRFFSHRSTESSLHRCYDALNIFETALREGQLERPALVGYFQRLKNHKVTILNELYEFDSANILRREPSFSQVSGGKTRSCPTQINTKGQPIPNLRVGLDVIDINEIDVKKNTFDCNLLYWVIADSQYIEKEGYIDFANISSEEANRYRIAEERDSNYIVRIYRISGKFLANFESFDFPFDRHEVRIPISALSSSDKIKISFDYSRLQVKDKMNQFKLNDWDTDDYFVTLDNQLTNQLGSLDQVTFDTSDQARYLEKYKNLNVRLAVSRRPWGAIILIIVPFLMFSALPIFMLFFHKASFEEVGELIITSFLATVAYSINLVQLSPTTDSMNRAYLFLLLTLAINFFCFIYVTYVDRQRSSKPLRGQQGERSVRRLRVRKMWVPFLLLVLFLLLALFIFA